MGGALEDSLVFATNLSAGNKVFLDAGSDVATFSLLTSSSVYGGDGGDTLVFSASLLGASIDAGADNDTLTFSGTVSGSTIQGGAGDDTMTFSAVALASTISLDSGADSIVFGSSSANNVSVVFGGGNTTVVFGAGADSLVFSGSVFGDVSLRGGSDSLVGASGAKIFGARIRLGDDADTLSFGAANVLAAASISGGAGNDVFSGSVSGGAGGVSFWGGAGNDTFNFSSLVSRASGGTAYFWNESGTDSIVLGNSIGVTNASAGRGAAFFGITNGAGLVVSFASSQTTSGFSAGTDPSKEATLSSLFGVAGSNLVTFGIGSGELTLVFANSQTIKFQGLSTEKMQGFTAAFGANAGGSTGNFGTAMSIPTFS